MVIGKVLLISFSINIIWSNSILRWKDFRFPRWIIFSFDRSAVFRFSVGSDFSQSAKGKLAFHFTNTDGTHDTYAVNQSLDLRDNQWHNVAVTFKANQAGGLKYYIDGTLIYTDTGSYKPISNHNDSETPRYGYVGNGVEANSYKGSTGPDDLFYG